jgi:hypothetical protein
MIMLNAGREVPPRLATARHARAPGSAPRLGLASRRPALAASSPTSAWSVWTSCEAQCHGDRREIVEHWTGGHWSRATSPALAALRSPVAVATSSARDAWVFNGEGYRRVAVHWNGSAWSKRTSPADVIRENESGEYDISVADFGPADV